MISDKFVDEYEKAKITIDILPYETYKKFVDIGFYGEEFQMRLYCEYVLNEIERTLKRAKSQSLWCRTHPIKVR